MKMNFRSLKQSGKGNGWVTILCYSILIVLLIAGVTGFGFAMYRSVVSGEANVPRVAAWVVNADAVTLGEDNSLAIDCNTDTHIASYEFWVENNKDGVTAEVDVKYSIVVELSEALPNGLTMQLDGLAGTESLDGLSYTFVNDAWVFGAGETSSDTHELTFTADADVIENSFSISQISVTVKTEQID